MGQFWTKKKDQEDQDEKLATPWAEKVGHGNVLWPGDGDDAENGGNDTENGGNDTENSGD